MKSKQITIWFNGPVKMESDGDLVKITGRPYSEKLNMDFDYSSLSDDKKTDRMREEILANIDLENLEIPDEYYYSCLPLCLLDAIYSIGAHYTSTKNVVERYCNDSKIKKLREPRNGNAPLNEKYQINDLLGNDDMTLEDKTEIDEKAENLATIVENHQMTSSRNGILKAQAVIRCALVLKEGGIQTIKDFDETIFKEDEKSYAIEQNFKNIKGQQSGISFSYLKMLCGDENTIKPDRHILRFLSRALGYDVDKDEAERLFYSVVNQLKEQYPKVTPRALDYAIWNMMRSENK